MTVKCLCDIDHDHEQGKEMEIEKLPNHIGCYLTSDDLSVTAHNEDLERETKSGRIRICWFDNLSERCVVDKPEDMCTLTYMETEE